MSEHLGYEKHDPAGKYPGNSRNGKSSKTLTEVRKVIYTTNAVESLNMFLRKITKNRGSFPNDEAALKLLY